MCNTVFGLIREDDVLSLLVVIATKVYGVGKKLLFQDIYFFFVLVFNTMKRMNRLE